MIASISTIFALGATFIVALFYFALAFGAPMGEYAFGRQLANTAAVFNATAGRVLGGIYRLISAFTGIAFLAISGHYASMLEWLPSLLDAQGRAYVLFGLTGLWFLWFLSNLTSKNPQEKRMFTGISGALLFANILILVFYRT
ncbi:MAG: hypothetical protein RLZ28_300, partial [Actinomycetota bacterium]